MRLADAVRREAAVLWRDGRGWILVSISLGWFLSIGVRLVYPALAPFFRADFGIGFGTTGLLLTLLWAAYAIGHIPGGILGDRLGEGRILVASTLIAGVTVLVVALSMSVWMLFLGTITFGLATALFGPTRFTVFTSIYDERAGSAIGITMAAGSAGNAVLPVVATLVAGALIWRYSFLLFVPAFGVVAIGLFLSVPSRLTPATASLDGLSLETLEHLKRGMTTGGIPSIVGVQICFSFVFQGFSGFYPLYLIESKGVTPGVASALFGLFFAASFVVQPLAGSAMDRVGSRRSLLVVLAISAIALWLLPFVETLGVLILLTLVLSLLNGTAVITQTYIADALPEDMKGTGLGTLKAGWMTVGATSPLLIGLLGDYGSLDAGFVVLAIVGSISVAVTTLKL